MTFKTWIMNNIKDFNKKIKSEEDLKIKALLPYLKSLGYDDSDIDYERPITVSLGTKKVTVRPDLAISVNDKVEIVIDTKTPTISLSEKDILQSESYAKLIETPPALYAITTNGIDCVVTNVITAERSSDIPSKAELLVDIDRTTKNTLKDIEIREISSTLLTLLDPKELYSVIKKSKDIIEKKGLIRSDQSFREMTKILLVKMNEERRVKQQEGANRFLIEYISASAKANSDDKKKKKVTELDILKSLFDDAKTKYPNIYTNKDENILINDNACIVELVKCLEPFSFLGTGDDIKGTVYEIFLKSTLRGELDQYFTPRELVDFMIKFADPKMGDKILDPACGSGGFLIQAFNYVNRKINSSPIPERDRHLAFNDLIDQCLWGHEADYDLHVLAKINLIMHGDGWNNIYQGDTLSSDNLPNDHFDLILMNPPFTIPYNYKEVLSKFELGLSKASEELDILFVEKSIKCLKPGRDLFVILPEGLLNNKTYKYFREWILQNTYIILSISLPEGAFIPFGGSVSKTCILGLRKKDENFPDLNKPKHIFVGRAMEVGYETGKKTYIKKEKNDLAEFEYSMTQIFEGIKSTTNNGECGWIDQSLINVYRLDANYLLNIIDRDELNIKFENLVVLGDVCSLKNEAITIEGEKTYNYLEIPDVSPDTGLITNIRRVKGKQISSTSLYKFESGDILFSRINPRISRVIIAPDTEEEFGVVSKEVFRIVYKKNKYIDFEDRYVLCSILQSEHVKNQIIRLSTGSSSSRARVQPRDLLNDVYIPIPDKQIQKEISSLTYHAVQEIWNQSQKFLNIYISNQAKLGSLINKDEIRKL